MTEYIKRDELYNNLVLLAKYEIGERQQGILGCAETVRMCPAADVAPVRHGKWTITEGMIENAVCSNCGRHFQSYYEEYRYCPNCGAEMMGETHESEKQL